MGLDGGTLATRSDLLRRSSWRLNEANAGSRSTRGGAVSGSEVYRPPSLDRQAEQHVKWTTCALSEQPLAPPVVADRLGSLFNREAVLEWLLMRRGAAPDAAAVHRFANQIRANGARFEHLASMKDVFPVQLAAGAGGGATAAAGGNAAPAAAAAGGSDAAPPAHTCPVTGLPCGRYTMVALAPCGHIISQRALERLGAASGRGSSAGGSGAAPSGSGAQAAAGEAAAVAASAAVCPVCGASFAPGRDDVIVNGSEEQVTALRRRLEEARQRGGGGGKRKRDKEKEKGGEMAGAGGGQSAAGAAGASQQEAAGTEDAQAQQQRQQGEGARPPGALDSGNAAGASGVEGGAALAAPAAPRPEGKRVRIVSPSGS